MAPSPKMRVALYARVSTAEEKELQNPETQLNILRDYCMNNGLEVVTEVSEYKSGKNAENREKFQSLVSQAGLGVFDGIVVLRMDRFMRNAEEGMTYIKRLEENKCKLILAKDNLLGGPVDTSTPFGEFFIRVILAIGELERKQTVVRVTEGIDRFRKEKGYWGRQKPGSKGRAVVNVEIAKELLKIKSLSETARIMKVPRNTLRDRLIKAGVEIPTHAPCRNSPPKKVGGGLNTPNGEVSSPDYTCESTAGREKS